MNVVHGLDAGPALGAGTGVAGSMPLPALTAGGFGASVDVYACEAGSEGSSPKLRLWLISLLGPQQSVRALWAQLVKGETATLTTNVVGTRFCALAHGAPQSWRLFRASLPTAGGLHGLILPDVALISTGRSEFLLLVRPDHNPATLHYRFLNRRLTLPLHPTWAEWLWERALRTGEARTLEAHGLDAYYCRPDAAALTRDLSDAIRDGALGLPCDVVGRLTPPNARASLPEAISHGPS